MSFLGNYTSSIIKVKITGYADSECENVKTAPVEGAVKHM